MKSILVPTDFSEQAQWATEVAIGIAKRTSATLILLHVVEYVMEESLLVAQPVAGSGHLEDKVFTRKLIDERRTQLEQAQHKVESTDVSIQSLLRAGNPLHGIRAAVAEYKPDLVVMGSSGGTLNQDPVGSTTEKVVRYATCPVLSIHEKPNSTEYKNIVYATSLSDHEKSFVEVVKTIQQLYNATIHLVRVNTPSGFQADHAVKKEMEKFVQKNEMVNYTLNVFSDYSEGHGILHFADQVKADMITMATHGRTGFTRLLYNSIAEGVVHRAAKPVLTCVCKDHQH